MSADRLRFVSIVGARPQFVKAAVVSRAIRKRHDEVLVHTGQHYDAGMSAVFFDEMDIPRPDVQLESGSGTHAQQTAAMLVGIEQVLIEREPDWVVTFGDTNSTLAGALAAAKLHLPIAHVEAGLRSFNWTMPEEINRVLVDRMSAALLCPSETAVVNLRREGILKGVHLVGDVMAEALLDAARTARTRSRVLESCNVSERSYVLVTVHRAENTDDLQRLGRITAALDAITEPVVFPVHPRTRHGLDRLGFVPRPHVRVLQPLGYLDMVRLLTGARLVLTDSGGVQKEAYWAGVPCVTLRDETEWVETVAAGWNVLTGADTAAILDAVHTFTPPATRPDIYGGAGVADRCVEVLEAMSVAGASSATRIGQAQ
jgi:UDP-N-acetylglucosamine 2-epimerase